MNLEKKITHYLKEKMSLDMDSAHDLGHLKRVASNCKNIHSKEGGNLDVLIVSSYFHDIVSLPKNDPNRKRSSKLAASKTLDILQQYFPEFPARLYPNVEEAIICHSYSANHTPHSIEAKILQDADRLDALGAIGLARVFYIAGKLNQSLFDISDPFSKHRELDDKTFALDHFKTKLLKLKSTMNTNEGRRLAEINSIFLINYMSKLASELNGDFECYDIKIKDELHDY
ncbi:HD domain-containing protein [Xenorhabdus bovienii]|uniref:Putative metal-dependent phosphohydrolase n=1 Tax=Xenorhabdus bovienii str. Intermedium TaxID=1379677 RepID=A0A077QE43_XENBV|nr:HD domain-containing protein [Xenorhabdus bovienii]MDE9452422.1 HD domain-containing protein [Xenorhabdus bovienii]MDE9480793.1 HD domain-containing protein [Xenorhabdus bovienii]MDE9541539.1 HD domain-containing protein [Xenorhabdus bovienii]MDE9549715.1 HD domain-containing protein [Xenorhabdus bovienii]MDE9555223.1 HD domain-containing protein [Xenorhabdus bovienii]